MGTPLDTKDLWWWKKNFLDNIRKLTYKLSNDEKSCCIWFGNLKKDCFGKTFANTNCVREAGYNHHPLLEYPDFTGTEHPMDLRPVSRFEFIPCDPVEKNKHAIYPGLIV